MSHGPESRTGGGPAWRASRRLAGARGAALPGQGVPARHVAGPLGALLAGALLGLLSGAAVAAAAADCNLNGREDARDLEDGWSADCNANGVPDECELAPLRLGLETPVPVPGAPVALAAGDLEGDATEEIVAALSARDAFGSSTVVVLGAGPGDDLVVRGAAGVPPRVAAIALEDLDGDGARDVVTAHFRALHVLWNDGAGSLGSGTAIETAPGLRALAVQDLDGDGDPDLVAANPVAPALLFVENRGGRTFGVPVDLGVPGSPGALLAADMDGGGGVDVAFLDTASQELSLLLQRGGGAFEEAGRWSVADVVAFGLDGGDLDLDGDLDVVVSARDGVVFFWNDGAGGLERGATARGGVSAAALADMDADGDLDLAVGSGGEEGTALRILLNGGGGRLWAAGWSAVPVAGTLGMLAVGRVDGDGAPGVAFASGDSAVVEVAVSSLSRGFQFSRTEVWSPGAPHALALEDLDGDGAIDVAVADGPATQVSVFLNDGNGGLGPAAVTFTGSDCNAISAGDFDQDGWLDLAVNDFYRNRVQVLLNAGGGSFPEPRDIDLPGRSGTTFVATGDLDLDGSLDLVALTESSVAVLLNDGGGAFSLEALLSSRSPSACWIGDIDGDAVPELIVAIRASAVLAVYTRDGAGRYTPGIEYSLEGAPFDVTGDDLDGDGDLDLVVFHSPPGAVTVLLNSGRGAFRRDTYETQVGGLPRRVALADVNADGFPDALAVTEGGDTLSIFPGAGGGRFLPRPFQVPAHSGARAVGAADLDRDGDLDVVVANRFAPDLLVLSNDLGRPPAPDYLEEVCTEREYHELSVESAGSALVARTVRFLLPAGAGAGDLPALFQNSRRYRLHQDFLTGVFPDRFPTLPAAEYDRLVGRRATREYFAGAVSRLEPPGRAALYGFSLYANTAADPEEVLRVEEVRGIYQSLREVFHLGPLAYYPETREAREEASGWEEPGFEVFLDQGSPASGYEPYTLGVGYGTVRLLSLGELEEANGRGLVSRRDILVLERAPRDIEGVVAGVITAERQGPLSHLAVRTARRGTPNAYLRDALERFGPYAGRLVRLETRADGVDLRGAELPEAEAYWEEERPELSELPEVDGEHAELESLEEMDLSGRPEARFGGKAANMARLERILRGAYAEYREAGFAVPVRYYLEFMRSNRIASALDPAREVSYEEYLEELLGSGEFHADSELRYRALEALRDHGREHGAVPRELVSRIAVRVAEVFGRSEQMVRLRSSSNVEDLLEFTGAGLYDSTSACAADELDLDEEGPSRCDRSRGRERGIAPALREVWLSLWNFRAYEERAYWGIPQDRAAMGVLVTRAFLDEAANGVAFTGDPAGGEPGRYVVVAQVGEASVVSPEPGVLPEKDILEVREGEVVDIRRAAASTLLGAGRYVLDDETLVELGRLLWHIDRELEVDAGSHRREEVLIDVEFKLERTGELAVKQVRPYLAAGDSGPEPSFELVVPEGTVACGMFSIARHGRPRREYELKTVLRLRPGLHLLNGAPGEVPYELFQEVRLGPGGEVLEEEGPGLFEVTRFALGGERARYRFNYRQSFRLPAGGRYRVDLSLLEFEAAGPEAIGPPLVLDGEFLTDTVRAAEDPLWNPASLRGTVLEGGPGQEVIPYSACQSRSLPLWEVVVELEGGDRLRLGERFLASENLAETGPAALEWAEVVAGGERRWVEEYWSLVYSAFRHNTDVRYWVVLEPPVEVGDSRVRVVEVLSPEPLEGRPEAVVNYLGEELELAGSPRVLSWSRREVVPGDGEDFVRGDFDADGRVLVSDAIELLGYLFRGRGAPGCEKAADATDDGRLELSDAVAVLGHLFRGAGPLPDPFGACGADPSPDGLGCLEFKSCP